MRGNPVSGDDVESVVYSGKTITASSGAIQSIATILGTADIARVLADPGAVRWVEVRGHSAAFYFGNSDHSDKDTQAAYLPLYRRGTNLILDNMCLRAVADAAITSVVIEVGYAAPDMSS
jgi:hypothetical protein